MRHTIIGAFATLLLTTSAATADTSYDFSGIEKSGSEFPKPACPAGTLPVINPMMPDLTATSSKDKTRAVFYRDTQAGGVIHLQTKEGRSAWQEVKGVKVHYYGDCHP